MELRARLGEERDVDGWRCVFALTVKMLSGWGGVSRYVHVPGADIV